LLRTDQDALEQIYMNVVRSDVLLFSKLATLKLPRRVSTIATGKAVCK